jgi:hypothetical protein
VGVGAPAIKNGVLLGNKTERRCVMATGSFKIIGDVEVDEKVWSQVSDRAGCGLELVSKDGKRLVRLYACCEVEDEHGNWAVVSSLEKLVEMGIDFGDFDTVWYLPPTFESIEE